MRNVSDKSCRENQNTHFICSIFFIFWDAIMRKNVVEPDRSQMAIWRMRIECWIIKATNTHSDYLILIAFPQQQWSYERASLLRYSTLPLFNIISIGVFKWLNMCHVISCVLLYCLAQFLLRINCLGWVHTCNVTAYRNTVSWQCGRDSWQRNVLTLNLLTPTTVGARINP